MVYSRLSAQHILTRTCTLYTVWSKLYRIPSQATCILHSSYLLLEASRVFFKVWHKNSMISRYLHRYAQPMSTLSLLDIILLLWFSFYHMDEALIWLWLLWEEPFFSWAKREMAIYWYFMKNSEMLCVSCMFIPRITCNIHILYQFSFMLITIIFSSSVLSEFFLFRLLLCRLFFPLFIAS